MNNFALKKSFVLRRLRLFWRRNYAVITVLPILLLLVYYVFKVEYKLLAVREYTFKHCKVTPQLDGTVIAFIADIHARKLNKFLPEKAIDILKKRRPDAILLGGDFVNSNGRDMQPEQVAGILEKFQKIAPVYLVPGNHEYQNRRWSYDEIAAVFEQHGMPLLRDQKIRVKNSRSGVFNLIALDYKLNPIERSQTSRSSRLVEDDKLNIVLTHSPSDFEYLDRRPELVLAGHTHGGQIALPLLGSLINFSDIAPCFTSGLTRKNGQTFIVTSGLSSAYTTARLCNRPEIVFITIKTLQKN